MKTINNLQDFSEPYMIPPGTLFAITQKQSSAIELGIILGKKIQQLFPHIATDFKGGYAASKIVKKYDLVKILGHNFKIIESAVYYALRGYGGHIEMFDIGPYKGLISDQGEFTKYAEKHNSDSGRLVGNNAFATKTGIFAMTKKAKYKASCAGAIGRGMVPYSKAEITFINKKIKDQSYQKGKQFDVKKIANEVNQKFHKNYSIRLPKSITKIMHRKKMRPSSQVIHTTDELAFIKELANDTKYQKGVNSLLKEICKEVNEKFHNGKDIRTPNGINKVIARRKLKNKPEGHST